MSSPDATESQPQPAGRLRGALRGLGLTALGGLLLLLTLWAEAALYLDVRVLWLRLPFIRNCDYHNGRDGVVSYQSAHVDYVQSEFIVSCKHSCLNQPATVQEMRRILHEHLKEWPPVIALRIDVSSRSEQTECRHEGLLTSVSERTSPRHVSRWARV